MPGLQLLLIGDIRGRFRVLLVTHERQARHGPVEQRSQLRTISLQQRFAFVSSAVAHHSSLSAEPRSLAGKAIFVKIRLLRAIYREAGVSQDVFF
jgi:hypothetical protein